MHSTFPSMTGRSGNPFRLISLHAPVHWLVVQEHFNDLVVGTYGRGFWILDDITPIQQLNQEIVDSDVHLFEPRAAYRFLNKGSPMITSTTTPPWATILPMVLPSTTT